MISLPRTTKGEATKKLGDEGLRIFVFVKVLGFVAPEPLTKAIWEVWEMGEEEAHFHPSLSEWDTWF